MLPLFLNVFPVRYP